MTREQEIDEQIQKLEELKKEVDEIFEREFRRFEFEMRLIRIRYILNITNTLY